MKKLSKPSRELAAQIGTEVDFENRFIGYRLHKRMGPSPVTMYSFGEVVGFLCRPQPQIDFVALKAWVLTAMGDRELADRIGAVIAADTQPFQKNLSIRDLMALRLLQCKKLVG
ncbi:MAG: hypothetical protein GY868_17355 [Deltaproteobacteria bacterium]|nr:hypothetical protein [Deltaproteobacteria bacterium]